MVWIGTKHRGVSIASVVALVVSLLVAPPSPLSDTPATAAVVTDPIGHWTFDEATAGTGTGTVVDSSGGGNDGTINGGALYVPGVVGTGALSFDGIDDYVDVGVIPDLDLTGGSYTIAFWVKQDASQLGRIVNMDDGDSTPYAGYSVFASGNMRVTHSNGGPNDFNVPSPFGVWSHTAVTYDSAALPDPELTLWIDGVNSGSISVPGGDLTTDGDDPLWFGGIPCCASQLFEGLVDDIRIYDVALSAGDINELATAPGLNAWTSEGYAAAQNLAGDWRVSADGTRVSQVSEASAAVFFGAVDAVGSHRVSIRGLGDNDFLGFVLGYQPGDVTNSSSDATYSDGADYLQLDWRRGTQQNPSFSDTCNPGGTTPTQQPGLTLSHIRGTPTLDELIGRVELADCPGEYGTVDVLATGNTLGAAGWVSNQFYDFEFEFDGTHLKVWVDGTLEFDLDVPGPITGELGFLSRSQAVEFVVHREILPDSYDMPGGDGTDQGGTYDYLDDTYPQLSEAVPLSGGLGDLSDGFIASENFNVDLLGAPPSYEPYVGWWTQSPTISFNFASPVDIGTIRVWVDDTNGDGQVRTPAAIDVTAGGETRSFSVIDPPGDAPFPVDLPVGGLPASSTVDVTITPQLVGGGGWLFVSEVEFFAPHSIQALVNAASPGDTIVLESLPLFPPPPGSDPEIYNETVYINKNLTIEGSGVTIDGTGLGADLVDGASVITVAPGAAVTLRDLTITGGSAVEGGGVFNAGNLTLDGVVVDGNSATSGGGIYNDFGSITLSNSSSVTGNDAQTGAGIYSENNVCSFQVCTVIVTGSTISGNIASGDGGGIYVVTDELQLTNSTVSGNAAGGDGGGIYGTGDSYVFITGSSVTDNTAARGGGAYLDVDLVDLDDATFRDNEATAGGGGGLYLASVTDTVNIADSTFGGSDFGNSATGVGGGLYALSGTTVITDTDFVENDSANGGGIYAQNGAITLQGVHLLDNTATALGGGMWADGADAVIESSVGRQGLISQNQAAQGGGVFVRNADLTLTDATVSQNSAGSGGGINVACISCTAAATITNANVLNNNGNIGGGLRIQDNVALALDSTVVSGNTASSGGAGLYFTGPGGLVDSSTFTSNVTTGALGTGGGVYAGGDLIIDSTTIGPGNQANDGAGLYVAAGGSVDIANSTVTGNTATASGGGIYTDSTLVLNFVTIAENSADTGGGVYGTGAPVSIFNTIAAGNSATTSPDCFNTANPATTAGFNFLGDPSGCGNYTPGNNGNLPPGSTVDLQPLADNGGPTLTHALGAGSDAIDAANDAGTAVSFNGFSAPLPAPLTFNGGANGAAIINEAGQDVLRTHVPNFVSGSAFLSDPLPITRSFSSAFEFQIEPLTLFPAGTGQPGDGFTFIVADSPTFLGGPAGRMGIGAGIGDSSNQELVAVEFDIFGADRVGIHEGADMVVDQTSPDVSRAVTEVFPGQQLQDNTSWYAWVDYDAETNLLEVRLAQVNTRPVDAFLSYTVDIADQVGSPYGYFGFTGASGAATANFDILNWSLATGLCPSVDQRGVVRPQGSGCDIGAYEADAVPPDVANFTYDVTPSTSEVGVAEVPIIDIPIEAIVGGGGTGEYEASPLGAIPLGAIPLGAIDLDASPLGAIPLGAIPLGAINVEANPLGAITLSSVPLGAIGGWEAILQGTVYEGVPLQNVTLGDVLSLSPAPAGLSDIDLNDIGLEASPLGAISLPSVALGDEPLIGIDPTLCDDPAVTGCDVAPAGAGPEDPSLFELEIAGAPLGAIPLGAIPLGAIDLASTPLGAIPLGAIPLGAIPLGAIPLGAIPLGAIALLGAPLGAIPLGAIPLGAIPLGAIPLGAIPLGAIPLDDPGGAGNWACPSLEGDPTYDCDDQLGIDPVTDDLSQLVAAIEAAGGTVASTPLGAIPLGAIPLGAIPLGAIPLGAIGLNSTDLETSPLGAIPLGAIDVDGTSGCALLA
ncbi:MAG: hypothetical protein KJO17_01620, partial [Acidimicrobiia bacterium]|nr:hypothetical protein [Acidimicrobiia bacterium]